ncbi:MAG: hypothetical protein U5L02_11395 [Rheinheimera sp.]|nr:hypothetical protein [Rheinheimera sp.]
MLDVVPASYRVIRIVRPKCSCRLYNAGGRRAPEVIKKGLAGERYRSDGDKYLNAFQPAVPSRLRDGAAHLYRTFRRQG